MFAADHNSAVRRNFKSRAMPEKEIPPARLVDIYFLYKLSGNSDDQGNNLSGTSVQKS